VDFVGPSRTLSLQLVGGRGHHDAVIAAVLEAQVSIWIATANLKELMIEDPRAAPGRRRGGRRVRYRSVLSALDDLVARGVELRLLHAGVPSGPFARSLRRHPRLIAALRTCPRVHFKAVVVDGTFLYLGSANWTGAGLGAKGQGRRNFELGVVTRDETMLDDVQGAFDRVWRGAECASCKLREECGAPLDALTSGAPGAARRSRRP
jgi:phosphatidylserine/phosphatidylglycerophosphate/cardiolipin synthase-like enzyme